MEDTGAQPLTSQDGKLILTVNGEIYNHIALRSSLKQEYKFKTHSDCEVIIPLVIFFAIRPQFPLTQLTVSRAWQRSLQHARRNVFFCSPRRVSHPQSHYCLTGPYRYHYPVSRLEFQASRSSIFASELKAIVDECDKIISFPPGHVYDSRDGTTTRYYHPTWWHGDDEGPTATIPATPTDLTRLRESLEAAVRKRLMSEVPYGVLLSGGLDSSLIASIAARETEKVAQAHFDARKRNLKRLSVGRLPRMAS